MKGVVEMTTPARLKRGDAVGIIAPASPPKKDKLNAALPFFEELGLKVMLGKHVDAEYGYLAGRDEEKLEDLHTMFEDEEIKAIFCACGGFGTARIASKIDYETIKSNPKIFWGYSDITFLHHAFYQRAGLTTFHGPMLSSDIGLDNVHLLTKASFQQLFEPAPIQYTEELSSLSVMTEGIAAGELIGGNLTLLVSTLGTPFEIQTNEKLLFIEEVDEEPYKVDRMLNQLNMAGKFADAAGIIIGDFHNCAPDKRKNSLTLEEVLAHHIKEADKPVMSGFKIGHCSPNIAIPHGVKAVLNTQHKSLTIEAGVV